MERGAVSVENNDNVGGKAFNVHAESCGTGSGSQAGHSGDFVAVEQHRP